MLGPATKTGLNFMVLKKASFEGAVSTTVLHTIKIRMLILKIEGEIILVCPPKKDMGNFKHI